MNRAGYVIVREMPSIGCGGQQAGWLVGVYPSESWTTTLASICYKDQMRVSCRFSTFNRF